MKYLNIKKTLAAWQELQPLSEKDRERLSRRFTVDFNYNSNHIEGNFGGILIRQLISEDGCEVLNGPWACAELFRCYDATGVDRGFPVLVEHDNGMVSYIRKPRVNLLRSNQSVEDKVNNILYQYHDNIQSFKETLYQDFINFKDKPYGYEQQIASR